ncbi:SRPBCC family protein, partial [Mycolicibacterium conceptionense]|uniref:SRPBCC family protein n=1 Tax=Mycolicibacterium conceptionense TaxID=451644 RepID=UPI002D2190EE
QSSQLKGHFPYIDTHLHRQFIGGSRIRDFAAGRGVDIGWASTDQVMCLHQYNVFPNLTLLASADHLTVMTSLPGPDPDRGQLLMTLMTRMPAQAPRVTPTDVRMSADEAHPGVVMSQDIAVLTGLQRGLHQPGFTHLVLSAEERRIINMHRNLERYLDLAEAERICEAEAGG